MIETYNRTPPPRVSRIRFLLPWPYIRALVDLARILRRRRLLIFEMAKREVSSEHAGKTFGILWGIVQPLFLLVVYAFIYGVVFKAKIGGSYSLPLNFTVYLLSGLVPWFAFQYAMVKGSGSITGNTALVKQVSFDLDILPLSTGLAACLSLLLGVGFLLIYTVADYHRLPWTYVALLPLLVVQFLAMSGVAYVLAALGVFLKDVRDVVQLSAVVLIFLMPIVYLPNQVPAAFNPLLWLNPFTYMIYCYQDVLYFGRFQHPVSWLAFTLWSIVVFTGGYRLFRRVKPFFADVL